MFYVKKIKVFIMCLLCISFFYNCSSADLGKKYTPVESGFMLEPGKSIAVISGRNDDNDIQLTEMVSEKLTATKKFKVLQQSDIKKMVPKYPLNLSVIDFSIAGDQAKRYTPYLTSTSKTAIDAVHKSVKTDYILVVWIEGIQSQNVSYYGGGGNQTNYMLVMSRLISYPEGNVAGYSARWNEDSSIFGGWEGFFKDVSKSLVKDIINKTK